jgi:hypothetical protein
VNGWFAGREKVRQKIIVERFFGLKLLQAASRTPNKLRTTKQSTQQRTSHEQNQPEPSQQVTATATVSPSSTRSSSRQEASILHKATTSSTRQGAVAARTNPCRSRRIEFNSHETNYENTTSTKQAKKEINEEGRRAEQKKKSRLGCFSFGTSFIILTLLLLRTKRTVKTNFSSVQPKQIK